MAAVAESKIIGCRRLSTQIFCVTTGFEYQKWRVKPYNARPILSDDLCVSGEIFRQ